MQQLLHFLLVVVVVSLHIVVELKAVLVDGLGELVDGFVKFGIFLLHVLVPGVQPTDFHA